MDKNPNLKATKPKKEHKEKKFYDEGQVKKLFDVLENEPLKYRLLIKFARLYSYKQDSSYKGRNR
ncbi:MAG: hypothetical protein PUB18_05415 [bacterium]|nr:hypothetical protein [bacterium]